MFSFVHRIDTRLADAMKRGDKLRVHALRMPRSAVQLARIEKEKKVPPAEDEVDLTLGGLTGQCNEAAEKYRSSGDEAGLKAADVGHPGCAMVRIIPVVEGRADRRISSEIWAVTVKVNKVPDRCPALCYFSEIVRETALFHP